MRTLFKNIKQLIQVRDSVSLLKGFDMNILPCINNAYLIVEDDVIKEYGLMDELNQGESFEKIVDVSNRIILPTWVDSHTHFVFAESRHQEFVDRINGLTYQEIAEKGGGILNSADKLNQKTEDELFEDAKIRLTQAIKNGTGAFEIKSGYGLSLDGELKMLRVIKRLKHEFNVPIKSTFLGAHALPKSYKSNYDAFVDDVINIYLPKVAKEQLTDYFDLFLEQNYFSVNHAKKLMTAAEKYGLKSKIHVNQFTSIGGVELAVKQKALSIDHLEVMKDDDFLILKDSDVLTVALPLCSLFLGIPYTPVKQLIENNNALVIATDYNPGTAPSHNMHLAMSLGCIKMKLTPEQSINASTHNAAFAVELENKIGSITVGKKANFIITKPMNHYIEIPYQFGNSIVSEVYINGQLFD